MYESQEFFFLSFLWFSRTPHAGNSCANSYVWQLVFDVFVELLIQSMWIDYRIWLTQFAQGGSTSTTRTLYDLAADSLYDLFWKCFDSAFCFASISQLKHRKEIQSTVRIIDLRHSSSDTEIAQPNEKENGIWFASVFLPPSHDLAKK